MYGTYRECSQAETRPGPGQATGVRCRFPNEYALAGKIYHPRNVYLAERDLIIPLDTWLARAFTPHRLHDTISRMHAAQPAPDPASDA